MPAIKKNVSKSELDLIRARLMEHTPRADVAAELGWSWTDWKRLAKSCAAFKELLSELRAREEDALVHKLLTAKGQGSTVATLFALKSRHGYIDAPQKSADAQPVNIAIVSIPSPAASVEEFQRLLAPPKAKVKNAASDGWELI